MIAGRHQAPYFIWHAPNRAAVCHATDDAVTIAAQLAALRSAGADGISLSVWLMENAVANGASDTFLDWSGGRLTTSCATNFTALLDAVVAARFNWVQVVPQFYGPHDFRTWTAFDETRYAETRTFLFWLRDQLAGRVPYLVDVCAEVSGIDAANSVTTTYIQRVWTDWTCWFWPNGVPCWDATMSFLPDSASVATLPTFFRGVDPTGPVNAPVFLAPHIYRGEQQQVYDGLQAAGLGGHPWVFGECFSLTQPSDATVARGVADFVAAVKQPVAGVCPWPVDPRTPIGAQISVVPPVFSQPWADAGF